MPAVYRTALLKVEKMLPLFGNPESIFRKYEIHITAAIYTIFYESIF